MHQGAQPRQQLVALERLDQVVVGAGVQAADPVAEAVARGDDQHRGRVVALAQGAQHVQPGPAWQAQVQQHRVVGMIDQGQLRRGRVGRAVHLPAITLQRGGDGVAEHAVVFHEQDLGQGRRGKGGGSRG